METNPNISQNDLNNPVKPKSSGSKGRWIAFVVLLLVLSFRLGYTTGEKGFVFEPSEFKVENQNNSPANVNYNTLWDAIKVVQEKYIETPPNDQEFLYGAVKGAVAATGDPYTSFFPPNFKPELAGTFDGIGAEIGKKDGNIVIVAPLPGTPAERAGLKAQDIVYKVDGQETTDWTVEDAVSKIRGKKGTPVVLTIVREGKAEPFDVEIIREVILVKSVKWEFKEVGSEGGKKAIAVLTISKFGDDTEGLFNQAVNEILSRKVDGIVVDLRNDPGGYLQTAVNLASAWVEAGKIIVTEEHSDGNNQAYKANGNNRLGKIKTVILINGGSASASEIFSGALRDHNIAQLIGEKSFGKGSVQELVDLPEGGAVKVTVAKWITPGGKNLNKEGLDPDIMVEITEEDITNSKDSQMEKALEEVNK